MIGINHIGYITGLFTSPTEQAIKTATCFLTLGGIMTVYYAQLRLATAPVFWSCTILTSTLIIAHLFAL